MPHLQIVYSYSDAAEVTHRFARPTFNLGSALYKLTKYLSLIFMYSLKQESCYIFITYYYLFN